MSFATRLQEVRKIIAQSAEKAGRNASDITLVAVSKHHPVEAIQEAIQSGISTFGENRVQEAMEKQAFFEEHPPSLPLQWHLIGTLQRKKVKQIAGRFTLIHSVDSLRLAETLQDVAEKKNTSFNILLQVNISREEQKHGIGAEETLSTAKTIATFSRINLKGVMGMAPRCNTPEEARPCFHTLTELSHLIRKAGIDAPEISMGMSADYPVAIEEGATIIRIGSTLFQSAAGKA